MTIIKQISKLTSIALVVVLLASCGQQNESQKPAEKPSNPANGATQDGKKIGYVNNDSLLVNFDMFKDLEEEFIQEKLKKQSEFEKQYKRFEQEYMDAQRQAQSLSPEAQQILAQKLGQREQELMQVQQQLESQLMASENAKTEESMQMLREFLDGYAVRHDYDMIYGYNGLGNLLYISDNYDITETIIDSLNVYYGNKKGTSETEETADK